MSQFLVLIYRDEAAADVDIRERPGGMTREHLDFRAKHGTAVLGGHALENAATARTVRRERDGALLVTDGAFAETKEALGGYYLIEAPDLDAAVRIAADVPTLDGGVEVRPIRTVAMPPLDVTFGPDPVVASALADAHRREWGFVVAATTRITRDLDRAEECVQDAYARALGAWSADGVPANPAAWLTTAARRRALDLYRRESTATRALPELAARGVDPPDPAELVLATDQIPDDRLRLILTCCHPDLPVDAQTALTLRLLCGMTTAEVARAFLVSESTMAARITRAKKRIAAAGLTYREPDRAELPQRIGAVLTVVHLLFTTGHTAPAGADLVRRDLVERSVELARLLRQLVPDDPDVCGLLALILLTDARRPGRVEAGEQVLLADQDRSRWDPHAITEGVMLVREALARRPPGRYALMAAIAAVHDQADSWANTDWAEIVGLYDLLVQLWPSPIVALNRAIAVGFADGPEAGLTALGVLADEPQLGPYGYLATARAEFLTRLGRTAEAAQAYDEAILLTANDVERASLVRRRAALP